MPRSTPKPILSLHSGSNADLMADAARLHIPEGALVADVTWGHGVFWRKTDQTHFTLLGSDLDLAVVRTAQPSANARTQVTLCALPAPRLLVADFCALPYRNQCLDVVVLDPPYMHRGSLWTTNTHFYNNFLTEGMSHQQILRERYCRGIMEAARVLKPGGRLLVKGKDEVEQGRLKSALLELHLAAERCGFRYEHPFIFHAQTGPGLLLPPGHTQHHPRLNFSQLLCFTRTKAPLFLAPHGRPKKGSAVTTLNGKRGVAYLVGRLLRDHPAVYARYMAGELPSVHAAARVAGLRARRTAGLP
jgi:hypothetical protein